VAKLLNKTLFTRIISSFVFLIILVISFVHRYAFLVVFEAFMLQCLYEFYKLSEKAGNNPKKWFGMLFSALMFLFLFLYQNGIISFQLSYYIIGFSFLSFNIELLRKGSALKNLASEFFGVFYIGIPFTMTNLIVFENNIFSYKLLLGILLIIWAYDVTAYMVGVSIGKRKIFADISPNKTLEGTVGGLVLGTLAAYIVYRFLDIYSLLDWFIMAILIVFGAFVGDLFESKLKRSVNVKDSGTIMPGHGGLLDRFDSYLFAIIATTLYLIFL
jgi:phosphatidate cytidylyltransferase